MLVLDGEGSQTCTLAIFAGIGGFEGVSSRDVQFFLLDPNENLPTFLQLADFSESVLCIPTYNLTFSLLYVSDESFLEIWLGDLFWES